jgi:hypothetical protein
MHFSGLPNRRLVLLPLVLFLGPAVVFFVAMPCAFPLR